MHTTTTSRPTWMRTPPPIVLSEPMPGLAHFVMRLPPSPHMRKLNTLIAGNQLAVSSSGLQAALHLPENGRIGHIHHTGADLVRVPFRRQGEDGQPLNTRVLWAGESSVLAWGQAQGAHLPGVWLITPSHASQVMQLDEMVAIYDGADGMYAGKLRGDSSIHLVTDAGGWPVTQGAQVTGLSNGSVMILENLGGHYYAYTLSKNGEIQNYSYAPCGAGEMPIQLLRWGDRLFLLVRTSDGHSLMREFGTTTTGPVGESSLDGIVEAAWNAPGFRSIAVLSRIRSSNGWYRRLELNGNVVYEGQFTMERDALTWSPEGDCFAAVIEDNSHPTDGKLPQRIVTPGLIHAVEREQQVREVLIEDSGLLSAKILTDGFYDYPEVNGRRHDPAPHAWNLHRTPDGATVFNSIHDCYVMCWRDETDVRR